MTEDQFRDTMIAHMTKQTTFLEGISEGMEAVRMFGRILKWIGGIASTGAGLIALWNFLSKQ